MSDEAVEAAAQQAGELNLTEHLPGGADMLPALTDAIGQRMLDRIEYLAGVLATQPDVKDRCIARVTERLGADTRCGYRGSLGTVVTVMALERNPGFELPLLVTLGSPLGLLVPAGTTRSRRRRRLVAGRRAAVGERRRRRRPGVRGATARELLRPPLLQDHAVNNGHRADDVEPYLNVSVTGAAVAAALRGVMTAGFAPTDEVARIRARLHHPIVDADGHQIEFMPLVAITSSSSRAKHVARRLDEMVASGTRVLQGCRVRNAGDVGCSGPAGGPRPHATRSTAATCTFPPLLYQRLDQLGIDSPCCIQRTGSSPDSPRRPPNSAAVFARRSTAIGQAFAGLRDRLEPVAVIPMTDPGEAVAELHYAVGNSACKAVMLAGSSAAAAGRRGSPARWMDTLADDSPFDYEPVWRALRRARRGPGFHSGGQGWGTRMSTYNYLYNHLGSFEPRRRPWPARCSSAACPGATPSCGSCSSKAVSRGRRAARRPARPLDQAQPRRGRSITTPKSSIASSSSTGSRSTQPVAPDAHRLDYGSPLLSEPSPTSRSVDEFASSGISGPADITDMFACQYHFGCEADDPMNSVAFDLA